MADPVAVIAAVVSAPLGAGVLRLAQLWMEKRAAAPSKAKDAADLIDATAAFQAALNAAAQGVVGRLENEIKALNRRVGELERENEACHALNTRLEAHGRELSQKYESLESWLRKNGVDLPVNARPGLIVLTDDTASMTTPSTPDQRTPGT